jgi:hypothetical protein
LTMVYWTLAKDHGSHHLETENNMVPSKKEVKISINNI